MSGKKLKLTFPFSFFFLATIFILLFVLALSERYISGHVSPPEILGIAKDPQSSVSAKYLDYIVITETPTPTPTPLPTLTPTPTPTPIIYPFPADINSLFSKYSNIESIDRNLLIKIAVCESGLNPKADNGIYGGLYQFSAGSWETTRIRMNLNPDPNLRFNAEEAIKTAAFKLAADGVYAWPHCH